MTINTEILSQALQITLIGMGLVFIGLLLLWALMEITVQLTAWYNRRHPEGEGKDEEEEAVVEEVPAVAALPAPSDLKQKAAAAAVAIALALEESAVEMAVPHSNGYSAHPSAWQAVMRSAQLNQRSNQFTRKPRGSAR